MCHTDNISLLAKHIQDPDRVSLVIKSLQ